MNQGLRWERNTSLLQAHCPRATGACCFLRKQSIKRLPHIIWQQVLGKWGSLEQEMRQSAGCQIICLHNTFAPWFCICVTQLLSCHQCICASCLAYCAAQKQVNSGKTGELSHSVSAGDRVRDEFMYPHAEVSSMWCSALWDVFIRRARRRKEGGPDLLHKPGQGLQPPQKLNKPNLLPWTGSIGASKATGRGKTLSWQSYQQIQPFVWYIDMWYKAGLVPKVASAVYRLASKLQCEQGLRC